RRGDCPRAERKESVLKSHHTNGTTPVPTVPEHKDVPARPARRVRYWMRGPGKRFAEVTHGCWTTASYRLQARLIKAGGRPLNGRTVQPPPESLDCGPAGVRQPPPGVSHADVEPGKLPRLDFDAGDRFAQAMCEFQGRFVVPPRQVLLVRPGLK